jgi:hypothetical protein
MRANQLRLYFSSLGYVLLQALRRLALQGTEWAKAQADTIRLRLLKIAAEVRLTARRIWVRYSRALPVESALRQRLRSPERLNQAGPTKLSSTTSHTRQVLSSTRP